MTTIELLLLPLNATTQLKDGEAPGPHALHDAKHVEAHIIEDVPELQRPA